MTDTTTAAPAGSDNPETTPDTTAATTPTQGSVLGGAAGEQQQTQGSEQGQASGGAQSGTADEAVELEITLPDGVEVDAALLEGWKGVAKKIGLNSESASEAATWYAEQQKAQADAQANAHKQRGEDWLKELKADPDVGGKNFEASAALARKAVIQLGGKELAAVLDEFGLGNHPAIAKAFMKAGKAIAEDSTAIPAERGGGQRELTRDEMLKLRYDKS